MCDEVSLRRLVGDEIWVSEGGVAILRAMLWLSQTLQSEYQKSTAVGSRRDLGKTLYPMLFTAVGMTEHAISQIIGDSLEETKRYKACP